MSVVIPEPLLELRGIRAGYGAIEVLHGVDLAVPAGGVLAVLGPNGAGKTTMLRIVGGLHAPTDGDVLLGGRRVNGADPVALARAGMCTIPEGRGIFPNLTVKENLQMVTYRGLSRKQVEERAFSHFPRLSERRTQLAGTMSGGEQQMLAVARAIVSDPSVLLLDELSMGLAPLIVDQLYEAVRTIAANGVTILVVEQFAAAVMDVADTAAVMVNGRVVLTGTPSEVAVDLGNVYLGGVPIARLPASENPLADPDPEVTAMITKIEASPPPAAGAGTESFKEEVRALKIKDPNPSRDALFLRIGLVAMVLGVIVSIASYFISHGTNNVLTQNDSLTIGMIGIAVTIAGCTVFLRYSLTGFLRFWLARFIVEQQRGRD